MSELIKEEKSLKAVDDMIEKGELKSAASTHSSKILPARTVRPHQNVGELVFKIQADGQVGVQCQIPGDPFYARTLASACMAFVEEMRTKGILGGKIPGGAN